MRCTGPKAPPAAASPQPKEQSREGRSVGEGRPFGRLAAGPAAGGAEERALHRQKPFKFVPSLYVA